MKYSLADSQFYVAGQSDSLLVQVYTLSVDKELH